MTLSVVPGMRDAPSFEARLAAVRRHGTDAVAFQSLESGNEWWLDEATGAAVAYVDTGTVWIAVGSPLIEAGRRQDAARRFAAAARHAGRRAAFFGVESLDAFDGFSALVLGFQPVLSPVHWTTTTRRRRRVREQLRRARAKHVSVRRVEPAEVAPGAAFRQEIERLRASWLDTRPMEPMGFLVAVEPFHAPANHVYVVAERDGRPIEFLSAVPIAVRGGWLIEDVLRAPDAPNGTTELVLDAFLTTIDADADPVTPGLTPLAGAVAWWLRLLRRMTVPLYDFSGLERFRERLAPVRRDPVYLVWDRGTAATVLFEVLRAFARMRIAAFAWRSLTRHPNGPPWLVAVPLVPWTALLAGIAATSNQAVLAYSATVLGGWIAFDAVLSWLLFHAAHRPRAGRLAALTLAAAVDAVLSIRHLVLFGVGSGVAAPMLRTMATAGPIVGTLALAWATWLAGVRSAKRSRDYATPFRAMTSL